MKYFPKGRQGYDDFYDILVGIGDIGVLSFAVRAIALLEDYLREMNGDACANWFRDYWTTRMLPRDDGYPDDLDKLRTMEEVLRIPPAERIPRARWER